MFFYYGKLVFVQFVFDEHDRKDFNNDEPIARWLIKTFKFEDFNVPTKSERQEYQEKEELSARQKRNAFVEHIMRLMHLNYKESSSLVSKAASTIAKCYQHPETCKDDDMEISPGSE
jgi:hypothetical protein